MTEAEGTVTGSQSLYPPGSPSGEGRAFGGDGDAIVLCVRERWKVGLCWVKLVEEGVEEALRLEWERRQRHSEYRMCFAGSGGSLGPVFWCIRYGSSYGSPDVQGSWATKDVSTSLTK